MRVSVTSLLILLAGAWSLSCSGPGEPPPRTTAPPPQTTAPVVFVDRAAETGLDFQHWNGATGSYAIFEMMNGGAALVDYDRDGDLDVYFVQGNLFEDGKTLKDALVAPRHPEPASDRLYQNQLVETGELAFVDVTAASGLETTTRRGYGNGVMAGDFDNDGWTDLYVTARGRNQLLKNRGDGTFEDVTSSAGADVLGWSTPAVFFDLDRDGWLDLWVGNYVVVSEDDPPVCTDSTGAVDWCGPASYPADGDRLLRNLGGDGRPGTFEDVTALSGLAAVPAAPALGVVAADFDGDGWLDLYVANDAAPNHLWRNLGDGTFVDDALMAGAALNAQGQPEASMGVDAADFDGDGDLDLFMTHLVTETNTLYLNDGTGLFDDATLASGLGPASRLKTSFGTAAIDYDNDGWLDVFVASGAVNRIEELARVGDPFPLHQPNQLFENLGGGRFEDVSESAGAALALSEVSRGVAAGDLDNDGDSDLVVVNNNGPARLLVNQVGQDRPWLGLRLVEHGRDAYGAKAAILRDGEPVRWRRVRVDGSYASANDPRLLFALGDGGPVDGVRVVWADGTTESFTAVPAGRYITLERGTGVR